MFHYEFYIHKQCICSTKNVKHELYAIYEAQTSMRKEMIPNSVDGCAEQLCSSAYFGASSIFAVAAVAFIRKFQKNRETICFDQKTREKKIAQIAHERNGKGIYA